MKRRIVLFLLSIVFSLVFIGCEILSSNKDGGIGGGLDSLYRLIELDVLNDSSSAIGSHQKYDYETDGKLSSIKSYDGPIAGPYGTPTETRIFSYSSPGKIEIHITRSTEASSDSLYEYDSSGNLIKVVYSSVTEYEMDTLIYDSSGDPKETKHFSKGTATRLTKHTIDAATGRIAIDSLFSLPGMELIGIIKYLFNPDSSLSEKMIYQLARGGINHLSTEKFTYNSDDQISAIKKFNAGIDETLLESVSFFYDSDNLPKKTHRVDELQMILLQVFFFKFEEKPSGLAKQGVSLQSSSFKNISNQETFAGLSTAMLADWESLYQQQEAEK